MILQNLKISTKILLAILLVWIILLIVSFVISLNLKENYIKLEDSFTEADMGRVEGAITDLNATLNKQAATWAIWDDAYKYALGQNDKFVEINLTASGIAPVTGVDMMLIFNAKGTPLLLAVLNEARDALIPPATSLVEAFKPKGALWKYIDQPKNEDIVQGLFLTNEGIILLGSHTIVKSDGLGDPSGTWITAAKVTPKLVETLSETTKLKLQFLTNDAIKNDPKLTSTYDTLKKDGHFLVNKVSPQLIYSYILLKDVNGSPIGMVKLELPRTVYQTSLQTLYYFNLVILAAGIIFAILLYLLLRNFMINRLKNINETVGNIRKTNDFSLKILDKGSDELASLGQQANKTLAIVNQYDQQNKKNIEVIANALTESETLTKKLSVTEKFLSDLINSMPSSLLIVNHDLEIKKSNIQAEKSSKESSDLIGKNLIKVFPFLMKYRDNFAEVIAKNSPQTINKIHSTIDDESHYYNVLIFPLSKEKLLSIRIDEITNIVKIEETLLQNDKMASIGVLTAGVAHEINNPINFVLSASTPLKQDVSDIDELMTKYLDLKQDADLKQQWEQIQSFTQEIDIEYTLDELQKLIAGMKEGIIRTSTIINDLQSASRSDTRHIEEVDIRESIDSSLNLLSHRFKDRIVINKNYEDIPKIRCYPGRINQVFVNIIANACDAIVDQGEITITTKFVNDKVQVSFKDTGVGISSAMLAKIFDPFFTTKEVGKGTGLGLSITSTILEEMGGTIDVKSEQGQGSEFIITLPMVQKEKVR